MMQNGRVLVPAGSDGPRRRQRVEKAGRLERSGRLTLSFDSMTVRGREHPIRGTATQVFESGGIREELARPASARVSAASSAASSAA